MNINLIAITLIAVAKIENFNHEGTQSPEFNSGSQRRTKPDEFMPKLQFILRKSAPRKGKK